ncbi:MAG: hypothetical protein ACYDAG_11680 [Chloroflexota bacterium]
MTIQSWTIVGVGAAAVAVLMAYLQLVLGKVDAIRGEMKADLGKLDARIEAAVERLDAKIEAAVERLDAKIEAAVERLDGKIEAAVERLDGKISGVREDIYKVGKQVEHAEGRLDEVSGIVRAAFGARVA